MISLPEVAVRLRRPHERQREFLQSSAKRVVVRAGRRGGKTTGMGIKAVQSFLDGRRILYAAPTEDQIAAFWWECKKALAEPLDAGIFVKNETLHTIELPGTKQRIRAKTAFNADTLRGDYADLLILDEWQLMDEDAWELVGAPMLLDNDGDAVFIYTPPSLRSRSMSKARDPRHASKMYKKAEADEFGRWAAYHFSSHDNPHISSVALAELSSDMTALAIRQEISAEDVDEVPGALWTNTLVEERRVITAPPTKRIVVGVDPSGGGDDIGIVGAGKGYDEHGYTLADASQPGHLGPRNWAKAAVDLYYELEADRIVAEQNFGGDMVKETIRTVDPSVPVKLVHASRGKAVRAEPVAALAEDGREHHVGELAELETEMTTWTPGDKWSPNRCFVAGTLVRTDCGDVPIENIRVGDLALTRDGYKPVTNRGMTDECAEVLTVEFSDGSKLTGTKDHPVWVKEKGWTEMDALVWDDIIYSCPDARMSSTTESSTPDGPTIPTAPSESISRRLVAVAGACFTGMCGAMLTAIFLRGITFTMLTSTRLTTTLTTSNASARKSMARSMLQSIGQFVRRGSSRFARSLPNGTARRRAELGTATMHPVRLPGGSRKRLFVPSADVPPSASTTDIRGRMESATVADGAPVASPTENGVTNSASLAPFAGESSGKTDTERSLRRAPVSVARSYASGVAPVYNLAVADTPEYFANGILVHNCDAKVWALTELMLNTKAPSMEFI